MAQPTMPVRGHHTAPAFSTNGPELLRFFEEIEFLFSDCNITDEQQKKRYTVRYVDVATADLWTGRTDFNPPSTYDVWKQAIIGLYPGTNLDRKYTMADLDLLIGERNRLGIYNAEDLASYHRTFLTITTFLIGRDRLTERERDQQFKRGLRDELWIRVHRRLEILLPNHDLDTPYSMEAIRSATEYLLRGAVPVPPAAPAVGVALPQMMFPSPNTPMPAVAVKTEDLSLLIDKLVQTIDRLNNPNAGNAGRPMRPRDCAMCSQPGHFINDCPDVERYIQDGKCRRNAEGRVVLPSGAYVPSIIRGRNLKEKFDEWHRQNPGNLAAGRLTANTNPVGQQMMLEVMQLGQVDSHVLTTDERIEALEREILNLRNKRKEVFDGVELPRRRPFQNDNTAAGPSNAGSPNPAPANPGASNTEPTNAETNTARQPPIDKGKGKAPDLPSTSNSPTQNHTPNTNSATKQPTIHPFSGIPDNRYVPPASRNLGAIDKNKPTDGPGYRTAAPITDPTKSEALFDRCLDSKVTVSVGELCSVAPEIRGKFREAVTPRRTTTTAMANIAEEFQESAYIEELDALPFCTPPPGSIVTSDPYETYLQSLQPGEHPERLTVAKESHSLRSILMLIDSRERVECIIDSGSQIIAMSEEVCHDLGIQYDPTIVLNMQSANGTVDPSLGLARNVPCTIGLITLYLQIHVIRNPAYDILLGRPFDVITCSNVKTYANDDTIITISDPNTDKVVSIPTFARGEHRRPNKSNGNFRILSRK